MNKRKKYILWFDEITKQDVSLVGGKNASLGEMYSNLLKKGINIPNGFAVTTFAYWKFLEQANLKEKISSALKGLDITDIRDLKKRGVKVRNLILAAELPEEIQKEIKSAYQKLSKKYNQPSGVDVAVRSSASAEDLPSASFAGQQESFLNIQGEKALLSAVQKCMASLFTDRAIVYRVEQGFEHLKVGLSVCVQKMVRSDLACSGVMFSCDTESNFGDIVLINSSYGLGDNIVQGKVNPDQFYVFETTLKKGYKPIICKTLGSKEFKMIYKGKNLIENIPVPLKERQKFSLTEDEILSLAKWSCLIEDYYKMSMDMEWAKDGRDNKLYIVQARPETIQSQKQVGILEKYILTRQKNQKILVEGLSVGDKIAQGKVKIIKNVKDITQFEKGMILVTKMTDPDWVPIMKIAKAIVTDLGGRTAHAAIVSRELGIPCIVGTNEATKILKNGQEVTVSCAEGEKGKVYQGLIPFQTKKTDISKLKKPKTKIMMNLGEPDMAFTSSFIPNDGVGLARQEFIISNYIKIHPLALVHFNEFKNKKFTGLKKQIEDLTLGYVDKKQFFIDKLAEGIGKIGAAFYPKPVIVRLSDFKTNEYRNLIGGEFFEQEEANPMLGFRGACRYLDPEFQPAFKMECQALKKVREIFGLKNIIVMVPFCRTVEEGKQIIKLMKRFGLEKGKDNLKIIVMCEIPSNVVLAEEFLNIFDGMSIGSNDLAQLCLGLDRDNAKIAYIGDERNEAVRKMIKKIIALCRQKKKYCGICGQGPSDFPKFAEFLVKQGIESISLTPDTIIKTILNLAKLGNKRLSYRQ